MGMTISPDFGGSEERSSDYCKGWRKISEDFRRRHNYTCSVCGVNCADHKGLIDVHHKNGVKSECEDKNLQCLCKFHHSKQPCHGHYKPKPRDLELLRKLWKDQKIPEEKQK